MLFLSILILGIVEGLTEFLPISSTGHLILASRLLGTDQLRGIESFEIAIQCGAILAVIVLYREKLLQIIRGLLSGSPAAWKITAQILVGFFPAALLGVLVGSTIKKVLFNPPMVVAALLVGGLLMIVIERVLARSGKRPRDSVDSLGQAAGIGLFQCLALWPGTSRSMATILGGRLLGVSARASAEFSFLLAIPTLIGATAYDVLKHRHELMNSDLPLWSWFLGLAVSFISAWLVIKWFISFLGKHSLESFGWYRIILAIAYWFLN